MKLLLKLEKQGLSTKEISDLYISRVDEICEYSSQQQVACCKSKQATTKKLFGVIFHTYIYCELLN